MKVTFTTSGVLAMAAVWMLHVPLNAQPPQATAAPPRRESIAGTATRTQWDGVFTDEQAERGRALYSEFCASCHRADLAGDDRAPSLRGFEFSAAWDDVPLGQLFDRVRTSMPQDNPNSLSRPQYADILAFILQQSNFPPGGEELSTESDVLNTIRFAMTKP